MAKKKAPVTVAGIRAKTKEEKPKVSAPVREPDAKEAYSFVADRFRKTTDGKSALGEKILGSATQVCEFAWQVPEDFKKFGAVGSARKYLSNFFIFLAQQVAKP